MENGDWINSIPLWAIFGLTLLISLVAVEVGNACARVGQKGKAERELDAPLGSLVGAVLGLLAFILAFTFGMAASRFDARKQLVLDESNALGTTYLRASLLPPMQGLEIRRLLREYVELRATFLPEKLQEVVKKSEDIHPRLWAQTKLLVQEEMDSEIRYLFIDSLNDSLDLHQSRKTVGLEYHIPGTIWSALFLLATMSMLGVGYQTGVAGIRRLRFTPVLAAAFALVLVLIADLDRPTDGFLRVSQQPILDVQQMMLGDSP